MRVFAFIVLLVALAGCAGTQPYSQRDFHQVTTAFHQLVPAWWGYEQAYKRHDTAGILRNFHVEQHVCYTLVDEVDHRDTIDPNVNLFHASASLDNICNSIEELYRTWAQKNGYPFNKHIPPALPAQTFLGQNKELPIMTKQMRHPSALT
ncbi:MAG: hypothetical protein ACR2GA_07970 [Chloroflexota bacterium]